jgi:hypothetical protein
MVCFVLFSGHGFLDVRPHDEDEVVRMDRALLLVHQLRKHETQRRHQAGKDRENTVVVHSKGTWSW